MVDLYMQRQCVTVGIPHSFIVSCRHIHMHTNVYTSIPLYVYIYIYMSYIYTFVCICICLHDTMRECGIPTVTHCLCMYRSTMLVLITCSTHVHIYHIHIYIHICLLYISDHSHTQVCIEGGSCPDGCETQPYYRMDVWQYLHWWTLL